MTQSDTIKALREALELIVQIDEEFPNGTKAIAMSKKAREALAATSSPLVEPERDMTPEEALAELRRRFPKPDQHPKLDLVCDEVHDYADMENGKPKIKPYVRVHLRVWEEQYDTGVDLFDATGPTFRAAFASADAEDGREK